MRKLVFVVLVISLLTLTAVAQDQPPLTNEGLIQMVQAGFDEATIIQLIKANGSAVDTSVGNLVELKNAGVSQNIILELLSGGSTGGGSQEQASATPPGEPEEMGVYVKKDGKFVIVEPEIVTWRTGGFLKKVATAGLTKGHVNGSVSGPHSRTQLSAPLEFLIICAEGTSAAEYQLLNLQEKKDRREFRAMTGGIVHSTGGSDKNAVDFEFERLRARTYKVVLEELEAGEYGLLPPGATMSASATSMGKIHTFGIE